MTLEARRQILGWVLVAPTLGVFSLVAFYPLMQTVVISLTDARLGATGGSNFVGLQNYRELLGDGRFWFVVGNTVFFTVTSVFLEFVLGLAIALIVHSSFRGRGAVRTAMLIPWAIPTVISARIWSYMLQDTYGVINDLLVNRLGLLDEKLAWLATPGLAMGSIIAVEVWKTTPFVALLLLAGLQLIPRDIYEAADVDGASAFQKLFRLTLPLLKPAILVALIFRTLDALRVFDSIWVLTSGETGTAVMATYNYRQMVLFQKLGFGSAISVAIFLLIGLFVVAYVMAIRTEDAS